MAERHGRAGARLLRAGEAALSAQRIAEHGRTCRPPVAPATRAAALAAAASAAAAAERRRELDTYAALLAQAQAYQTARARPRPVRRSPNRPWPPRR